MYLIAIYSAGTSKSPSTIEVGAREGASLILRALNLAGVSWVLRVNGEIIDFSFFSDADRYVLEPFIEDEVAA